MMPVRGIPIGVAKWELKIQIPEYLLTYRTGMDVRTSSTNKL